MESIYNLIERAQKGDQTAKEQIIHENKGLLWAVVKRFPGRGDPEDLFQVGVIGLLKCIENFDFTYNVKFSTYAVPMIMGEIRGFLRDDGTIKVSRNIKELAYHAKKIQEEALKNENKELSIEELAKRLNTDKADLILALESTKEIESIYAIQNHGDKNGISLIDTLAHHEENEKMIEQITLKEVLSRLNEKERKIILMRYYQDRTQIEVAKHIGISQVQVSRIEKKILRQMRESLK